MKVTANNVLAVAKNFVGFSVEDPEYKKIVKIYNSYKPLTRNCKLVQSDNWSDAFISVCFIIAGDTMIIGGTEKDLNRHIIRFKRKKIWHGTGTILPKVGDLVIFDTNSIGIVEMIQGRVLTVITGDKSGSVGRIRLINNDQRINGYVRPKYVCEKQAVDDVAREVLTGKWGNGFVMKKKLTDAGYDYDKIQKRVCELS